MSNRILKQIEANDSPDTHCSLCGRRFSKHVTQTEEHIFPSWLQHLHDLWTLRLTIPNLIGKTYNTVKIPLCPKCNNERFSQLEVRISETLASADPYAAASALPEESIAAWLGKIFWLLAKKGNSVVDYRTRNQTPPDQIIPNWTVEHIHYVGLFERTYATGKGMLACFASEEAFEMPYRKPFSLYRYRIDPQSGSTFDYFDTFAVNGIALRSGNLGLVCLFDGGLHEIYRSDRFALLQDEVLHPLQFNELAGRIFYDQTVLDPNARVNTFYWNDFLNSVVAQVHLPRGYDPYLQENDDPSRFAVMIGRLTFCDPNDVIWRDENGVMVGYNSVLFDSDGGFYRYPSTEEEVIAAKADPRLKIRSMDMAWRKDPLRDGFDRLQANGKEALG
jgi:hypothetical protein